MTLHIDYENGSGLSLDPQETARAAPYVNVLTSARFL